MNSTDIPPSVYRMSPAEILETTFLGFVCVFGTVGNLLVVAAVSTTPALQVRQNVFIVVLAITDLIATSLLTPFFMACLVNGGWPLSDAFCISIGYITILCLTTSGLTVNFIAVSRAVTVAYTNPVRRKHAMGKVRILASTALLTILVGGIIFPLFGFGDVGYNENLGHCSLKYDNSRDWGYTATLFLIGLISTLTVVPISYGLIFWIFRKSRISVENLTLASRTNMRVPQGSSSRKSNVSPPKQQRKMLSRDELKLSKKLLLLFSVFLLCWIPYTSVVLADKDLSVPREAHRATNILLWINSGLNPYLYAWMIPTFRQSYKRLIIKILRKGNIWIESSNYIEYDIRSEFSSCSTIKLILPRRYLLINFVISKTLNNYIDSFTVLFRCFT